LIRERVRRLAPSLVVTLLLFGAPVAFAGPICEDRAGESVRCEDPRAMPLGWTPSLEQRLKHPVSSPPEPTPVELGGVFALIVLFFTLIALMPDFDGWEKAAPDVEDNDDEPRD
jgi:hypothetical protein